MRRQEAGERTPTPNSVGDGQSKDKIAARVRSHQEVTEEDANQRITRANSEGAYERMQQGRGMPAYCLQVVWQLSAAGVAWVHRDVNSNRRDECNFSAFERLREHRRAAKTQSVRGGLGGSWHACILRVRLRVKGRIARLRRHVRSASSNHRVLPGSS